MGGLTLYKVAIVAVLVAALIAAFVIFRNKRKELALVCGATVLSLFICEIVLRVFFPQISQNQKMHEYDPELGWRFIPSRSARVVDPGEVDHTVKINSLGFRDVERDLSDHRKKRVVILGDSFVSNIAVEQEDVFTQLMETQLPHTEVWNLGVNGYGQVQEYLLLEKWFDRVKPDVVVVVIYVRNDFQDNLDDENWTYGRPFVSLGTNGSALVFHSASPDRGGGAKRDSAWRFYRRSHLFALFDRSLARLARAGSGRDGEASVYVPTELFLCRKEPAASTNVMFEAMEQLTLKLRDFSSARGAPMVFVLAPSHVQVYDDLWREVTGPATPSLYDRFAPDQRMMRFAASQQVMMFDLLPAFIHAGNTSKSLYYRFEQHWTRAGNQLVARELANYLRAAGLAN